MALRATVAATTQTGSGDPITILVDGADTPVTANGLPGYAPTPGDRLLVERVSNQIEVLQFIGDELTITGAKFQTALSGQRWEIDSPAASNQIRGYSDSSDEQEVGGLFVGHANDVMFLEVKSGSGTNPGAAIKLESDDTFPGSRTITIGSDAPATVYVGNNASTRLRMFDGNPGLFEFGAAGILRANGGSGDLQIEGGPIELWGAGGAEVFVGADIDLTSNPGGDIDLSTGNNGRLRYIDFPTTTASADVRMNSGGQIFKVSSLRANKDNIADIPHDHRKLLELRGRVFTSRLPQDDPELVLAGFIVNEADELGLEEWVERDDETGELMSFRYPAWTAALQEICRAQQTEIDELRATQADLIARLDALEAAE